VKDDIEAYKQFVENESFKRFLSDMVFTLTTEPSEAAVGMHA
jgi:type I restriction enzyme R subunit